ncbi:hypothetical protein ALC57_00452 [Trachymyrmex cornetzi]|uniref:Uncharacterized protein n=1 Tax=Trachymyrmex cornetzi TaxID=471704 RepID=A0A151JSD5_9HYME|nr:hypothetical protein ALC57_00452 [Trachymyrmex cornetzi]
MSHDIPTVARFLHKVAQWTLSHDSRDLYNPPEYKCIVSAARLKLFEFAGVARRKRLEFPRQKEDKLASREMVGGGNWEDTRSERKKDEKKKERKENTESGMLWLSLCTYTQLNARTQARIDTVIRNT